MEHNLNAIETMVIIVKKSSPKHLAADCRSTVSRLSANSPPTGFATDYQSADRRPTVGDVSVTCRYNVNTNLAVFFIFFFFADTLIRIVFPLRKPKKTRILAQLQLLLLSAMLEVPQPVGECPTGYLLVACWPTVS